MNNTQFTCGCARVRNTSVIVSRKANLLAAFMCLLLAIASTAGFIYGIFGCIASQPAPEDIGECNSIVTIGIVSALYYLAFVFLNVWAVAMINHSSSLGISHTMRISGLYKAECMNIISVLTTFVSIVLYATLLSISVEKQCVNGTKTVLNVEAPCYVSIEVLSVLVIYQIIQFSLLLSAIVNIRREKHRACAFESLIGDQ